MIGQILGVSKRNIQAAEEDLGIIFPEELKRHWLDIGYGTVLNGMDNDNMFFSPAQVCAFRRRCGRFKKIKTLKGEKDRLCFFMENEENCYCIDLSDNKIYVDNVKVADSINDFMNWIGG